MSPNATPTGIQLSAAIQDVVDAATLDQAELVQDRHLGIATQEDLIEAERRMAAVLNEITAIVRRFAKGEEPLLSHTIPQLQALADKIRNRTI